MRRYFRTGDVWILVTVLLRCRSTSDNLINLSINLRFPPLITESVEAGLIAVSAARPCIVAKFWPNHARVIACTISLENSGEVRFWEKLQASLFSSAVKPRFSMSSGILRLAYSHLPSNLWKSGSFSESHLRILLTESPYLQA